MNDACASRRRARLSSGGHQARPLRAERRKSGCCAAMRAAASRRVSRSVDRPRPGRGARSARRGRGSHTATPSPRVRTAVIDARGDRGSTANLPIAMAVVRSVPSAFWREEDQDLLADLILGAAEQPLALAARRPPVSRRTIAPAGRCRRRLRPVRCGRRCGRRRWRGRRRPRWPSPSRSPPRPSARPGPLRSS